MLDLEGVSKLLQESEEDGLPPLGHSEDGPVLPPYQPELPYEPPEPEPSQNIETQGEDIDSPEKAHAEIHLQFALAMREIATHQAASQRSLADSATQIRDSLDRLNETLVLFLKHQKAQVDMIVQLCRQVQQTNETIPNSGQYTGLPQMRGERSDPFL